ncbi:DMT family transporter [Caproiciproducens faecalis]|uniref:EamA family transporter n=1 Tax=Caproiciproducens faecalis TaxID=2820301 RepID=A0ABS7DRC8_9FIRM|nr:DMT family transporter [Caproiciproducens faecalis]MBW7573743.1 EamA family transporter [Caproiciproducens faecalis]
MKFKNPALSADLGLVFVTIIWGSAFVVVKNATSTVPASYIIAIRFAIAVFLMSIFFFKRLRKIDAHCIKSGAILGVLLFVSYYLQTIGVKYTTAGNNAFLTAIYVVVVPFLYWLLRSQKPDLYNIAAALICIVGIGLLSLHAGFTMNIGDILSLLCGVGFASQIVATSILTEKNDPILLSYTQFVVTGSISLVVALCTETFPARLGTDSVLSLLYIGVFSTLIALVLQTVCQKYSPPARASLIMSLESLFGSIFGIIFLHEALTPKIFVGSLLILLSILISETKPSFFRLSQKKTQLQEDILK